QAPSTQVQKIVIITAYLMSLDASARVFEGLHGRQSLGEQSGLHLLCNLQFLCGAAFRFQLLGSQAALSFNGPVDLVVAHKRKRVSIYILEPGEYSAPNRLVCGSTRSLRRVRVRQVAFILDPS